MPKNVNASEVKLEVGVGREGRDGCVWDLASSTTRDVLDLANQRTLVEVVQQVADIFVDLHTAFSQKLLARPAAGRDSDRPDACVTCGFGVVGGVTEGEYLGRFKSEALERSLKDVRMRLGVVRIVGRTLFFDQVFHIGDLLVGQQIFLAGGARERESNAGFAQAQQELAHAWDGLDLVEILLLEHKTAECLERLLDVFALPPGNEHGDELVATFADLSPHIFKLAMHAYCAERHLPRLGVQPVALDERPIDIAQQCLDHGPLDAPYTGRAMTATELNENFALEGLLHFEQDGELTRAQVTLGSCTATVYLQGAHLTAWQPAGAEPVFFLSERSVFAPGKAIRGGVPLCFPWFGGRSDGRPGPSHGFARISPWELAFAALMPDAGDGDRLQLTFVLGPTELSRSLGFDSFRVAYELLLGRTLTLRLTVANLGTAPLRFEEALHSYFQVADVRELAINGLEGAEYLDKRDDGKAKHAPDGPLNLTEFSDRVFPGSKHPVVIEDAGNRRSIRIDKQNSATTVVWNPWPEGSASLADLGPEDWPHFLCVEAANTATDALVLEPGATHTMTVTLSTEPRP